MHKISRKRNNQTSGSLLQCKHENVLAYDLSEEDKADFSQRLNAALQSQSGSLENGNSAGDFHAKFLTPHGRGQRAKSLLMSRATQNAPTTASKHGDYSPEQALTITADENSTGYKKQRSSTRVRGCQQRMPAPSQFRNCADCGCFYFNTSTVAIKPRQYCFRVEILPAQLICTFMKLQKERPIVAQLNNLDEIYGQELYLHGRKRIIDGVYKMGVKFQQARETIHIAIEMIDQHYLKMSQEMTAKSFKLTLMHPGVVILHQVTVLLIASKFDEVDDNITAICDLRDYVRKQVAQQQRKESSLIPSFTQIVECERKLLVFFNWNIKFVLPLHILRAYLANGVIFSSEFKDMHDSQVPLDVIEKRKAEWSRSITTEALSISDLIVSKGNICYRKELSSDVAASIVYLARKNILEADSPTGKCIVPCIWPHELVMITRCTEDRAKRILVDVLRPAESAPSGSDMRVPISSVGSKIPRQPNQPQSSQLQYESASILSPASMAQSALTSRVQREAALSSRVPKAPFSVSILSNGTSQTAQKLPEKSKTKLQSVIQPQNNRVLSQKRIESSAGEPLSTYEETVSTVFQTVGSLPGRQNRAQTLIENIQSSVEILDRVQEESREHQVQSQKKKNEMSGYSKTRSQQSLFKQSSSLMPGPESLAQEHDNIQEIYTSRTLRGALSEDTQSAYGTSLPPKCENANSLALQKQPISSSTTSAITSCEKVNETSAQQPLSEKTMFDGRQYEKSNILAESSGPILGQFASVMQRTEVAPLPEDNLSSAPRLLNELPEDLDTQVPPVEQPPEEERLMQNAQLQPIHPKLQLETQQQPVMPTKSSTVPTAAKKNQIKSKYLEVKKAQIAKNESTRKLPSKKNSAKKQQLQIVDKFEVAPNDVVGTHYPGTTRHSTQANINQVVKGKKQRRALSNKAVDVPHIQENTQTVHCQESESTLSNEYFSVVPKMMGQIMTGQDQLVRNSSQEYEARVSQRSVETNDTAKQDNPGQYQSQVFQQRCQRVPSGGGPLTKSFAVPQSQAAVQKQLTSSQVSFFKREQQREQAHVVAPRKLLSTQVTGTQMMSEPIDFHGHDQEHRNLNEQNSSHLESTLPKIDSKPSSSMQVLNAAPDFATGVDRYGSVKDSFNKRVSNQKQLKKMTSSGTFRTQCGGDVPPALGSTQHHSQSTRQFVPHIRSEENLNVINQASSSNFLKTKSTIFVSANTANMPATATKTINGFGSSSNAFPSSTHMGTQKVFAINQLKKGPSFQQMQYIVTPTQQTEAIAKGNLKLNQQKSEPQISASQGGYNQMANFKSNLISTQRMLNRSGSIKAQQVTQGSSSQMTSSNSHVARFSSGSILPSSTLNKVAADEAFAKLQQHQSLQKVAVPKGMSKQSSGGSGNGVVLSGGSILSQTSLQGAQLPQQMRSSNTRQQPIAIQGSKAHYKMLNVEQNKPSTFLAGQQKAQAKQLMVGRSVENIKSVKVQVGENNNSHRLRHLKTQSSYVDQYQQQHKDAKY